MRCTGGKAFILFFLLAIAMSFMCQAMRDVEDVSDQNIYQIDYNGPQTHALPPPGSGVGKGKGKGSMPNHSGVKNIGKQKKPIHA